MTAPRSALATAVAVAALVLVACGGDDDSAGNADDTGSGDPAATTASPTGDGPDATIDPGVPDEFLSAIGPVEVVGDALPVPETPAIDDDPALGMEAPVLVGLGYEGEPIRIDAAENGPTMVVFLAHWCPHCNAEIPRLNELRDEGRYPDELDIVAVSTAVTPGRPNFPPDEWLDDMDWTYPAMADGIDMDRETFIAADAFGLNAFPFVALVDDDGTVAARWSGESEPDEIIERIDTYLGL